MEREPASDEDALDGVPTVLLVEDNDLVRNLLLEELRSAGEKVVAFAQAEPALDQAAHMQADGVVVTDLDLGGGMDGFSLGQRLRAGWPGLGVIYMTGRHWLAHDHKLEARERVLLKPFRLTAMLEAIVSIRAAAG